MKNQVDEIMQCLIDFDLRRNNRGLQLFTFTSDIDRTYVTPRACPHHYLVAMSPPSIEENQRDTTILMFLTICHLTQIYSKC